MHAALGKADRIEVVSLKVVESRIWVGAGSTMVLPSPGGGGGGLMIMEWNEGRQGMLPLPHITT